MTTKLVYTIPETGKEANVCRQTIYDEINSGRLKSFKVGRRRLVSGDALRNWITLLEKESATQGVIE